MIVFYCLLYRSVCTGLNKQTNDARSFFRNYLLQHVAHVPPHWLATYQNYSAYDTVEGQCSNMNEFILHTVGKFTAATGYYDNKDGHVYDLGHMWCPEAFFTATRQCAAQVRSIVHICDFVYKCVYEDDIVLRLILPICKAFELY